MSSLKELNAIKDTLLVSADPEWPTLSCEVIFQVPAKLLLVFAVACVIFNFWVFVRVVLTALLPLEDTENHFDSWKYSSYI